MVCCQITTLNSVNKTEAHLDERHEALIKHCGAKSIGASGKHGTGNVMNNSHAEQLVTDVSNSPLVMSSQTHCLSSCKFCITVDGACAVIPKSNKSGNVCRDFDMKIIKDTAYHPANNISPVAFMQPHGAKFFSSDPAILFLPVYEQLKPGDEIVCLSSDTEMGERLNWKPMDPDEYEVCGSYIKVRTTHFSFYTTVVNKGYPEVSTMIHAGEGGILEVPDIPGVAVIFPGSAVQYDIEATLKVVFADGPYDVDHNDPTSYALAAPVVKVGPSGHHFNPDTREPVKVRLPLPNAREILENCGRPYLTFWESTSGEGQPLEWKLFQTDHKIEVDDDGLYTVCFAVHHFTFFRVLWSIFDSAIHEAKIGASFFYPHFQFYIMLQAFMSVNEDDATFGLCIICYRMGNPLESIGNYPIFVGSSGPRMITSGLLQIRVVSSIFEANADFGEECLTQQELFTGRPFDKQFACKFIRPKVPVYGTIGKVYIEKRNDNGTVEPLFDFLLNKPRPGQEMPQAVSVANGSNSGETAEHDKSWETQLSKELATLLSIKTDRDLGDDVWEDIALTLGYKPLEIDMKFRGEDDPLEKLLEDYKKRGGSPNDFISAMYRIRRKENLTEYERRIRHALPEHERHLEDDMVGQSGSVSPSRTSSSSGVVLPSMPVSNRKRRYPDYNEPVPQEKLLEIAKEKNIQEKWKNLGRTLGVDENQIVEIDRNYENDGIQEKAYQMFLAWKERHPDHGHDELTQALGKLQLNRIARQLNFSP